MFKSKNQEERQQEIREAFAEKWEKSSQYEANDEFYLVTPQQAKIKIWIEDDPFHMFMEMHIGGWLIEKDETDLEVIMAFLNEVRVD